MSVAGHSSITAARVYAKANDLLPTMSEHTLDLQCKLSLELWDMIWEDRGPIYPPRHTTVGFRSAFSVDGRLREEYLSLKAQKGEFDKAKRDLQRLGEAEKKVLELEAEKERLKTQVFRITLEGLRHPSRGTYI
jgi:hypothetical protein